VCEKIAQNVHTPIHFCQNWLGYTYFGRFFTKSVVTLLVPWKNIPLMRATSVISKVKMAKVKNSQLGENSTNLVTLVSSQYFVQPRLL
jgi:hypothetical protein